MKQQRVEGRFLCADLVRLDWIAGDEIFGPNTALLEDISPLGGCVQLEEPVALGPS